MFAIRIDAYSIEHISHFCAYSRQIQISFLFLKRGGMGIKNDACFPIIFFHSHPFLPFHCFLPPLSSHRLSICDRRGRMFDVFCKLCKRLHTLCSTSSYHIRPGGQREEGGGQTSISYHITRARMTIQFRYFLLPPPLTARSPKVGRYHSMYHLGCHTVSHCLSSLFAL